ncbi:MAG TPA: thioredoxin domain-containing protein, partial [Ktedonobacteraceae bacterium]
DAQNGGFFDTGTDHETLITRPKDIMDNATPAGNSVAIDVLVRLAAFTGEAAYRERADEYLQPLANLMVEHPQSFGHALGALDFAVSPAQEFAIVGDPQASDTHTLLNTVNSHYQPNSVLASCAPGDTQATQSIALLADRPQKEKRATIYVCQNFACLAPINEARELEQLL